MSIATDAKVRELEKRVAELEARMKALESKQEARERTSIHKLTGKAKEAAEAI